MTFASVLQSESRSLLKQRHRVSTRVGPRLQRRLHELDLSRDDLRGEELDLRIDPRRLRRNAQLRNLRDQQDLPDAGRGRDDGQLLSRHDGSRAVRRVRARRLPGPQRALGRLRLSRIFAPSVPSPYSSSAA